VAAAEAYARLDLIDAALDAANQALRVAPDLPEVHLGLARLYFRRGWRERAADTLLLLDRFLEIEPHPDARAALADTARQHLSADPRLEALAQGGTAPAGGARP
jgi:cytochrome c-type biogenesis protein CcmH/NrfG